MRDTAALAALLRDLKVRSGLTLRELEGRAQGRGDVLARSTVSDMLRGTRLPGPGTLAAYVRACGAAEEDVPVWLEARQRAEAAGTRPSEPAAEPGSADTGEPVRRTRPWATTVRLGGMRWWVRGRMRWRVLGGAATAGLAVVSIWTLSAAGDGPPSSPAPSDGPQAASRPLRGFAEIRPARSPHLCLTEGRDTRGEYLHAVAAQLPCEEARPPHTYLRPVDPSASRTTYYIEWQHPQQGRGCLTMRREGPGQDLLEPWPWKSCDATRPYQHFHIESADGAADRYLLRLEDPRRCVGLRGNSTRTGADVMVEPCDGTADQEFLISSVA
ncbi:helix-turn-helix domain-containing protein [Streptomyces beigongshangae]|uniref:helix-turn-helix domain-containing protein n=1 Tax=Streptomyces beigongshangae TaxID=2841597 RepID=UPI001C84A8CD|nr:helix-turn-helix transcriptional regulator [Streptomyces sp. REN17]